VWLGIQLELLDLAPGTAEGLPEALMQPVE
jgi:hypothetical protein